MKKLIYVLKYINNCWWTKPISYFFIIFISKFSNIFNRKRRYIRRL